MDSSVQSPDMTGSHLTPDPFCSGPGGLPLANSMHAMVPYPSMTVTSQPQNAEFANRMTRLEQQQFQDGVNSYYRSMQTSQSLQYIQQQLHEMQQKISYDIPALQRQVQTLQAKLEHKENEESIRQIQLQPRSHEQMLYSAMKNANLARIYTSTSIHGNATPGNIYLRRAEQMEALATSLRGRIHRGGAAYLTEAEDAEAWAAKLREDAKTMIQPGISNKSLMNSKTIGPPDADIIIANLEAQVPREELVRTPIPTPHTKSVQASSSGECAARILAQDFDWTQDIISTPKNVATPAQSVSAKRSFLFRTPSAKRSKSLVLSVSAAVSVKTREPSENNASPVQVKAAPELPTRRLAPHLKYAAQKAQASKKENPEVEGTVPPPNSIQMKQAASPMQEKIVSVKNTRRKKNKKRAPHHRITSARSKTPEPSQIEPAWTANNNEPWPSEAAKSDEFLTEATKQPELQAETEESSSKIKVDFSSKKQDDPVSTLNSNISTWQPTYLKDLPLLSSELEDIPSPQEMHAFNRTFITTHLGGMKWLPSFYSVPEPELSLLPGRGYFLLEDTTEPLAPSSPGAHGSLVTPILRLPESDNPATPKPESMQHAPLFIKRGNGYVYYGMYSHLRSDRLDLERCNALIPSYLKDHWASQLTSPHRPKWVTEALQNHLRPPPSYTRPSSSASSNAVTAALDSHHRALESWHRDTSLLTSFLRPANILTAFAAPDTGDATPGLRFWCLGLKCEGWDKGFYDMMCREEKVWEKEGKRDGGKEREKRKDMLRILGNRKPIKW